MTSPLIDTSREEKEYFDSEKARKAEYCFNERIYGETLSNMLVKSKNYNPIIENTTQIPISNQSSQLNNQTVQQLQTSNSSPTNLQNSYIILNKDNEVTSNHSSCNQSDCDNQVSKSTEILDDIKKSMVELKSIISSFNRTDVNKQKAAEIYEDIVNLSNKNKNNNKISLNDVYQLVQSMNETNLSKINETIVDYLTNINKDVETFKKNYNETMSDMTLNYSNAVCFSKLTEEENELLKLKIKSYDKYIDDSVKYNIIINNPTYSLYNRLTKYKSLVPGIYDKFNNMLDDFDRLEIDNTELTDYSKIDKDIKDCFGKHEQKFNKSSLVHERCEWVKTEEEMVANLTLFKPNRYIEFTVSAKNNIGCVMSTNGVFLRNEAVQILDMIDLPVMKYSSHLIGFKVILKENVIKNNVNKLKFILYSGRADIQSFTYNINTKDENKSLVSPRFNLPDRLIDEKLSIVSKGIQYSSSDITSISVDPTYVKDIYCYYRINSSVVPNSFRNLNLQEKYKFKSDKVYNIFIRSYNELQDAAMNNRLDIVKWIMYGDEYEKVCDKYNNIKLCDINEDSEDYDNQYNQLLEKKKELKDLLYIYYGDNVVDKNPVLRFEFVLKQALEHKASDVALFLIVELVDHLDHKVSSDNIFASAAKGADINCVRIVLKYIDYMKTKNEEEEDHLLNKRSSVKHQDLYHADELNNFSQTNKVN